MQLTRRFTNQAGDLFNEFDRIFRHTVGRTFGTPAEMPDGFSLYEADQSWLLRTDLPGFRREDLEITVADGLLTITGSNKDEDFTSDFSQSLRLPKDVRTDAISARLEHGVLELVLPKVEPVTPENHRIEVN